MTIEERVARAICLSLGHNPLGRLEVGDETIWRWEAYQPAARAAIEAYKAALADAGMVIVPEEPTEAMLDSGGRERSPLAPRMDGPNIPGQTFRYKAGDIWKAMIAEARK